MAAPPIRTISNLTGNWMINNQESDDYTQGLTLQGLSWLTRKTIQSASVTLKIKQFTGADEVECIYINQVLSFGISGTTENRHLDWSPRTSTDRVFGVVTGKSKKMSLEDVMADESLPDYVKLGWEETAEAKKDGLVVTMATNDEMKWTALQVWGFANAGENQERKYVRRIEITKTTGEHAEFRLVYDYKGDLSASEEAL